MIMVKDNYFLTFKYMRDHDWNTETFKHAIDTSNIDLVRSLLDITESNNSESNNSESNNSDSLALKKHDISNALMDVRFSDTSGRSLEIVKLLLERGADVNSNNVIGVTPLHLAVTFNNVELARLLLENGADIDRKDNYYSMTPLMSAAQSVGRYDDPAIVELLLDKGANISIKDKKGDTALKYAWKNPKVEGLIQRKLEKREVARFEFKSGLTSTKASPFANVKRFLGGRKTKHKRKIYKKTRRSRK